MGTKIWKWPCENQECMSSDSYTSQGLSSDIYVPPENIMTAEASKSRVFSCEPSDLEVIDRTCCIFLFFPCKREKTDISIFSRQSDFACSQGNIRKPWPVFASRLHQSRSCGNSPPHPQGKKMALYLHVSSFLQPWKHYPKLQIILKRN